MGKLGGLTKSQLGGSACQLTGVILVLVTPQHLMHEEAQLPPAPDL